MKRIDVKLAVPVVAPLLDVIKDMAGGLGEILAAPLALHDLDADFRAAWSDELLAAQKVEVGRLLGLFDDNFFREGVVAFDADNAEVILRACAAIRLRLRARALKPLADEVLEGGGADLLAVPDPVRKAFMCYLFLATLQELIIQNLDESILGS